MDYEHVQVESGDEVTRITLNRPEKRNALSLEVMTELLAAFRAAGETKSLGILLTSTGPVFSAGHDFADMAGRDLLGMRALLRRLDCSTFEMTVAASSVIRPGVSESGMMQAFIERHHDP